MVAAGLRISRGRRLTQSARLYSVALVELGDWDDDADASDRPDGFASAPLPPHERAWRHPSEIGAAKWAASEPPLVIGRGLSVVTGTIGLVLAAGLLWAMLPAGGGSPSAVSSNTVRLGRDSFSTAPTTSRTANTGTGTVMATLVSTTVPEPSVPTRQPPATVVVSSASADAPTPAVALASASGPLAVTTAAAIGGASSLDVTLSSGQVVTAQVLMVDPSLHIAVLALPTDDVDMSWEVADAIADGDPVVVLGPNEAAATIVISDAGVTLDVEPAMVGEGALVLDASGRLVGLCTHGDRGVSLVAATDITQLAKKVDGMALTMPWLGVELADATGTVADAFAPSASDGSAGLTVTRVVDGGPAATAGLLVGDRLVTIDGVEIRTFADVVGVLSRHRPSDVIVIEIDRVDDRPAEDITSTSSPSTIATSTSTTSTSSTSTSSTTAPSMVTASTVTDSRTTVTTTATSVTTSAPTTTSTPPTSAPTTSVAPTIVPTSRLRFDVTLAVRPSAL